MSDPSEHTEHRRYRWPWIVLALVVFGIVLAILWVAFAARQVHDRRALNVPPGFPNSTFMPG